MFYLFTDNSNFCTHSIVTLKETFVQRDFTGAEWTRAYCTTIHELTGLSLLDVADFGVRDPSIPLPAGGSGSYKLLTDEDVDRLLAMVAAKANAEAKRDADHNDAARILNAIPEPARSELRQAQKASDLRMDRIYDGGEGFFPNYGWDSRIGREIAARHGLDVEAIAAAARRVAQ